MSAVQNLISFFFPFFFAAEVMPLTKGGPRRNPSVSPFFLFNELDKLVFGKLSLSKSRLPFFSFFASLAPFQSLLSSPFTTVFAR